MMDNRGSSRGMAWSGVCVAIALAFCVVGCGGRSAKPPRSDAGAGTDGSGIECHFDSMRSFVPGETFPRDCNTCTCGNDGVIRCTTEPCSCVERPLHHALGDTFSFLSAPPDGLPQCLPSCGLTPHFGDGLYSVDALPAGACDLYTLGCSMRAHRGCQCPNEAGPLDSFVCLCQGDDWTCQVTSHEDAVCADACSIDAGAADAGPTGPCELTRQLALSDPTVGGEFNIGGDLLVGATLTNLGPRDHNAYPGIEVTTNVNLLSTNLLTNAAYALRSGESIKLSVTVRVPATLACVPITFHIRARSFGAETICPGPSVDIGIVLNMPDGGNCPACPVIAPANGGSCSPQGLSCRYGCDPANCDCRNGHWDCAYCI